MFITLINGEEGGNLVLFKGASDSVKVQLLNTLTGAPENLTGDTSFLLELYADAKRSAVPIDSITITPTTATAGYGIITVANGEITTAQGVYFGFVKRVTSGSVVGWSRTPAKVIIK
jgi:hypothetical protein